MTSFHRLFARQLGLVKWRLAVAGVCSVGVAVADLLQPWPLKIIIDHGILNHPLPSYLAPLGRAVGDDTVMLVTLAAGGIVLIALFGALFSYLQVFITSSVGHRIVYTLRSELFAHLQRLSLSFHNKARSGDLITRISSDTSALGALFVESLLKFSSELVSVVGMFAILLALNWRVGLIALSTLPFLSYTLLHLYRKTRASARKQRRHEAQVASRMNETLYGMALVQAFAREKHEAERFDTATAQTLREGIRIARLEAAATRSSEIITALGSAVAVLYGALQVLNGSMMPGELVLVVAYVTNAYKPLKAMARLSTSLSKVMASADRLTEVLDIEPEIKDRPDAIDAGHLRGAIEFRDVSFDYGDGREVLRGVSFSLAPGQRLALVGASGAGKSTLASLLLRLYEPRQGAVFVDGIDIRQYRRESLRHQIGTVLQQSILFGASIRENIAYGNPEADPDELIAAARVANADEFIRELEDGYETVIGERGTTLSGGQRQRISIARAVIRNAPVLILDEPMTALDVESEQKVREALDRLMAGKTCIMITHDLPSTVNADLVLMLEDGLVVDRGTHAELVGRSPRYRQLYELSLPQASAGLAS